jgi:hypothetical protein
MQADLPTYGPGWKTNSHIHFHFTPVGSSWINQIETWFGIIPPVHPPGHLQQYQSPDQADTQLHHALKHQGHTIRLVRYRR